MTASRSGASRWLALLVPLVLLAPLDLGLAQSRRSKKDDGPTDRVILKAWKKLDDDEVSLATVVLHELVHQTYFAPGRVAFNETLANAVGMRLAIRFFESRGEDERAAEARRRHGLWLARSEVLDRLASLMRPGGWLGLMTCFQTDDARFANWSYRREPTHVVFYRQVTLARIAQACGWLAEFPAKDVALMRFPGP